MPGFTKDAFGTPFGKNEFLRSTQDVKTESYTVSRLVVPSATVDGATGQKVLQPGTVMAKITVGSEKDKIGPYQAAGTNEVQTLSKTGTVSGGTYTLSWGGFTTAAIAYNANAAAIKTAFLAATGLDTADLTVTGGPASTTDVVFTFVGLQGAKPQSAITVDYTAITGGGSLAVAETTPGVAGAKDGRELEANVVGLLVTFLPWQLMERDVEVAVAYECAAVQANCLQMKADGTYEALNDTVAAYLVGKKHVDVRFKPAASL